MTEHNWGWEEERRWQGKCQHGNRYDIVQIGETNAKGTRYEVQPYQGSLRKGGSGETVLRTVDDAKRWAADYCQHGPCGT